MSKEIKVTKAQYVGMFAGLGAGIGASIVEEEQEQTMMGLRLTGLVVQLAIEEHGKDFIDEVLETERMSVQGMLLRMDDPDKPAN
jgi:hypothetical protein